MFHRSTTKNQSIAFDNGNPVALIVGVASLFGVSLAEKFLAQKVNIVGEDVYTKDKSIFLNQLYTLGSDKVKLINSEHFKKNREAITKLDYILFLLPHIPLDESSENLALFSEMMEATLSIAVAHKSKVIIISDINVPSANHISEYLIQVTREYASSKKLNIRMVKMGEVYGKGIEEEKDVHNDLWRIMEKAINAKRIEEQGSGLTFKYFIHVDDAVNAIFTALFSDKTIGNVFSAASGNALSIMAVAYMIGALANKEVAFSSVAAPGLVEDRVKHIPHPVPDWEARIPFDKGIEALYREYTARGVVEKESLSRSLIPIEQVKNTKGEDRGEQMPVHSSILEEYRSPSSFDELKAKYLPEDERKEKSGMRHFLWTHKMIMLFLACCIGVYWIFIGPLLGSVFNAVVFGQSIGVLQNSIYNGNPSTLDATAVFARSQSEASSLQTVKSWLQKIGHSELLSGSSDSLTYAQNLSQAVLEYNKQDTTVASIYANLAGASHLEGLITKQDILTNVEHMADGTYIIVQGKNTSQLTMYKAVVANKYVTISPLDNTYQEIIVNDMGESGSFPIKAVMIGNDISAKKLLLPDGILWVQTSDVPKSGALDSLVAKGYAIFTNGNLQYYIYTSDKLADVE